MPVGSALPAPAASFNTVSIVKTESYYDYPENAPSDEIVVEAVFGALGMVVTPTCHIAEGEKDQEIVAGRPGTAPEPRHPVAC
jgi:hypothetical protein